MAEFKTYDEQGNEVVITKEMFQLRQSTEKIFDQEFETKPTTFLKDAFRRFTKNKSSVVGACIIGLILLLAFIVPIVSPHDIDNTDVSKTFLPPKLFASGFGFWDGTKSYEEIPWDEATQAPAGFSANSVLEITKSVTTLTDYTSQYATGGYMVVINDNIDGKIDYIQNYLTFDVYATDNVQLKLVLGTEEDYLGRKLGSYRVLLTNNEDKEFVLRDWSKDYSTLEVNLSDVIASTANQVTDMKIRIEVEAGDGYETYILIEQLLLSADSTRINDLLSTIQIADASYNTRLGKLESGAFPDGYWQSTGRKLIHNASITYVDFVYDWYNQKLGVKDMIIGKSTMDEYIKKGWCEFDYKTGEFTRLSDKCPINEVYSCEYNLKDRIYNIEVSITMYKYKGYNNMPIFLFGTDESGHDLVTKAFSALRLSLLISLVSSAVCFIFGLCWGSVSGYFGGNIDLAMERFCDILGGVPWIVVMTLAILLLGNNVVTFALALCLTGWMGTAARTRTQFYRFKGREYILASRTLGANDGRLIFKHILPNAMGTIITSSVLMIPSTIFSEATLSYLNLGLQGSNSFGNILSNNQQYLNSYPALIVFPAIIISLIMISFNLFGNGLRDAFNPSLKGSE